MELTEAQYRHIERCLPIPRGNITLDNLQVLNAILYVAKQGCEWPSLRRRFGNWHTIQEFGSGWKPNSEGAHMAERKTDRVRIVLLVVFVLWPAPDSIAGMTIRYEPQGVFDFTGTIERVLGRAESYLKATSAKDVDGNQQLPL